MVTELWSIQECLGTDGQCHAIIRLFFLQNGRIKNGRNGSHLENLFCHSSLKLKGLLTQN